MNNIQSEVQQVFAEVTRYPIDILDPTANLEEDLGIDSVKLGEVFSVLRERFHLASDMEIQRDSVANIESISRALEGFAGVNGVHVNAMHAGGVHVNGVNGAGKSHKPSVAETRPSVQARSIVNPDLSESVREVFAAVTRYPVEILDPEAGLEDDLGIDSVKLGEVFSVLRERYSLPADMQLPRESLATISAITSALGQHLLTNPTIPVSPTKTGTKPQTLPNDSSSTTVGAEKKVTEVFAEVTRYPADILHPDASLEEDLGIDSVKLGEVFSVLRERFHLPEELVVPREQLGTIRQIAVGISRYIQEQSPVRAAVASLVPPLASERKNELDEAALYHPLEPQNRPFTGKVLFVSGSGRGLGRDVVTYLAKLGASVVVNSFHSRTQGEQTAKEIRDQGGEAVHLWGSMANPEHVSRVFDEIETHFGHLDFFVGNASNGMLARLEDLTVEHWEKAYRTNVIGLHQSALRAVQLMRRRGGGKIITLSSPASHGYVDYFGCMGTVKAAVESLTRSMAIEFAKYNIQVNCVSPGPVYGDLLNKWPESDRLVRQWESNTAYNRLCEARDVSHFIAYLLSEPVKLFTGSVLVMDGGISSQGW